MDLTTIAIAVCGLISSVLGFFIKRNLSEIDTLKDKEQQTRIELARLDERLKQQTDRVSSLEKQLYDRLDRIEAKLDDLSR